MVDKIIVHEILWWNFIEMWLQKCWYLNKNDVNGNLLHRKRKKNVHIVPVIRKVTVNFEALKSKVGIL